MDSQFVPKIEKVIPSTVDITDQMLPAIRDWKVGEQYCIELTVEMVNMQKGSMYDPNDQKTQRATFKVIGAHTNEPEDQPATRRIEAALTKDGEKEAFMRAVRKYVGE